MDLANYYGMAERYWGLANAHGLKPCAQVWIDGVKAERSGAGTGTSSSSTSTSSTSTSTTPVNHAPTAAFAATASQLTVSVDGAASSDPDGQALTYKWSFGDGSSATG